MKFCIFGAGAIGGYLAVGLMLSGQDVCIIARGEHLRAIQTKGLKLLTVGEEKIVKVPASDKPDSFGPQDYVLCTLKSHQSYIYASELTSLLGPDTAIVTAMNGIPWWYFYKTGGPFENRILESVDPGGRQWRLFGPERAIGCVVESACEVIAPGIVRHRGFNRFIIGEPDGQHSERVIKLSEALSNAGFDAPIRDSIRWNVWLKLFGNVCFNPISALTSATLDRIATDTTLRELCKQAMYEARAVADELKVHIGEDMIERRLNAAGQVAGHRMSMLQDLERCRSMEIDALITAVQELGKLTDVSTPTINVLSTLVKEKARRMNLYKESPCR
ncbi:2-dehydropantoate 2-reductase [Salmonella enterica]|nr:2-dehydropantoate 2-reductase [Salmonella enterica]